MLNKPSKVIQLILCFLLIFEQSGFAQASSSLDLSGYISGLKNTITQDKYRPLHLRYLGYDAKSNDFKLLLDKGDWLKEVDRRQQTVDSKKENCLQSTDYLLLNHETNKLMEYFFIGLALPNESFWVNLRPDSPNNIIDSQLAKTDIGRILLEADVQLKKDTALYTSPQTKEGKEYWNKLYKKAEELYGYDNITIPTLTRPWIVPGEIIIRETLDNAYIYKATLKVMLEEDYLKVNSRQQAVVRRKEYEFKDSRAKELNTYSTQLIKELVIPKITKEVNTSRKYAKLRQVYYSLILAQWFKSRVSLRGALSAKQSYNKITSPSARNDTTYVSLINSSNLTGLISKTTWTKETYYQEYQKSFKYGEYNLKEPASTPFGQTIRSYFSGGVNFNEETIHSAITAITPAKLSADFSAKLASSPINNYLISSVLKENTKLEITLPQEIKTEGVKAFKKRNHPQKTALFIASLAIGIFLFNPLLSAFTNKQTFSKGGVPQNIAQVEKGDNIWNIIKKLSIDQKTTVNNNQIQELIQKIKFENPQIINEDVIFPGQEINVGEITDKLTLIRLLSESKLIAATDINIGSKKTTVYFIEPPETGAVNIAIYLTDAIIINITEFKAEVGRIKEQCRTAYKGLEDREKFIKELFDNKSDYQIFSAYLKETFYHEIAHQATDTMIEEGNLQADIEKLFSQTRYYQSIDLKYSIIQELAGLLAQLTYSSNPKYFLDILKLKALGRGLQGPQYQYAGTIITKIFTDKFKERFLKTTGDRRIEEKKQENNGNITKEDEDLIRKTMPLYYEAGVYTNQYKHFYEFINTLSNEEIKNTAREIYEKYFGELPSPDLIKIPQKVFETAGYKSSSKNSEIFIEREKPAVKQTGSTKNASSAILKKPKTEIEKNKAIRNFIERYFSNELKQKIANRIKKLKTLWDENKNNAETILNETNRINNETVRIWSVYFFRGRIYNPVRDAAKEKQAIIFEFGNNLKEMLYYDRPNSAVSLCFAQLELNKAPLQRILITQGLKKRDIQEKFERIGVYAPVSYLEESGLSFYTDPPDKNKYYHSRLSDDLPSILGHKSLLSGSARRNLNDFIFQITDEIDTETLEVLKDNNLSKLIIDYILENRALFKKYLSEDTPPLITKGIIEIIEHEEAQRLQKEEERIYLAKKGILKKGVLELAEKIKQPQNNKRTSSVIQNIPFSMEPFNTKKDKGGIDFGAMPIVTQTLITPQNNLKIIPNENTLIASSSLAGLPRDDTNGSSNGNTEWLEIEKMVNAGIIPSAERIKEYLVNSGLSGDYDNSLQKVLYCMAAVLRMQEERPDSIEPEFKNIISSLESGNFTTGIKN